MIIFMHIKCKVYCLFVQDYLIYDDVFTIDSHKISDLEMV